jgi:hypothetical protein
MTAKIFEKFPVVMQKEGVLQCWQQPATKRAVANTLAVRLSYDVMP